MGPGLHDWVSFWAVNRTIQTTSSSKTFHAEERSKHTLRGWNLHQISHPPKPALDILEGQRKAGQQKPGLLCHPHVYSGFAGRYPAWQSLTEQNPSSEAMLHLTTNQNCAQWGTRDMAGITQDFTAVSSIDVRLAGSWCEVKWELLTGFGMTFCFTMKKLWSIWYQSLRKCEVSACYCFFRPFWNTC